jgi:hypothetical protein
LKSTGRFGERASKGQGSRRALPAGTRTGHRRGDLDHRDGRPHGIKRSLSI